MIRPIRWLVAWFTSRRLSTAQKWAADWMVERHRLQRKTDRKWRRWERQKKLLDLTTESIVEDRSDWEESDRQQEHVVEALRNENKILGEILVPNLTAANELALQRAQADVSVQVRRQVFHQPDNREEG